MKDEVDAYITITATAATAATKATKKKGILMMESTNAVRH